ncbi:phosphotransferase enzyme family protein [Oceaniglobus roseus]|uniref:phosphotransferase enzyme family protein n=1 Tax=Oceaniglobus roseus TaxID=1737570 RepID=UPI000C7F3380|nr:phosphotransferase [Kandeliimicrobium roseum]
MTDDEALAHAVNALRHWGGGPAPRLIRNRENAVFRVALPDGTPAALRLHRAGYQTDAAIRSELLWTEALAEADFPCPRPLRTDDGHILARPAFGPRASLVTWIDAPPIGLADAPFDGRPEAQADLYHRLGRLLLDLHRTTDALTLPADFERPRWDLDGLTGATPLWGCFWTNPALGAPETALLSETRDALRAELSARPRDTGLIHADLMQENVLHRDGRLSLIDFDDSGFGFRLYDLGTAMVQHWRTPHRADLAAALCDGYGRGHADLPMFTLLRALASAGWIVPRTPPGDPRQRIYAERAVTLARAWLS